MAATDLKELSRDVLRPQGVTLASYETYKQAQRAVDYLADEKFPVQYVTIVGNDLRQVEHVTGRMSWGRALAAGFGSGAWVGLFVGLLLGLFALDGAAWIGAIVTGIVLGGAVRFGAGRSWLRPDAGPAGLHVVHGCRRHDVRRLVRPARGRRGPRSPRQTHADSSEGGGP
jgi:hypothetical protein